jgi:hypothetical protein
MSDEHQEQEIDPMDDHLKTLEQFKGSATTQDEVLLQRYRREAEAIRSMPSPTQQDRDRLDWLLSEIALREA